MVMSFSPFASRIAGRFSVVTYSEATFTDH
jgi:hypothetical protein